MKKKIITYLVAATAIGLYAFPAVVAKAGTDLPSFSLAQTPSIIPQILHLKITAYTSVPEETDSTPFITANGTYVHDGIVATNLLPFGTRVQIPSLFGNKVFIVEDRMNKIMTNGMDIWMPTKGQALYFGVHFAPIVIMPGQDISLSS